MIAGPSMRIKHEFEVYSRGFASGLTPEPLWKAPDALFCRYLPYRPLMSWVKSGSNLWPLLREGSAALDRLHREAGVSHMDASLGNVIAPGGWKTLGTLIGAGGGALLGRAIDAGDVVCR